MAFSLTGHDLLSADAEALTGGELTAHTALAADLLDFADYEDSITGSDYEAKALRALALQVNLDVEQGVEAGAYEREEVDSLSRYYRDVQIHPKAALLRDQVLDAIGKLGASMPSFEVLRSRR